MKSGRILCGLAGCWLLILSSAVGQQRVQFSPPAADSGATATTPTAPSSVYGQPAAPPSPGPTAPALTTAPPLSAAPPAGTGGWTGTPSAPAANPAVTPAPSAMPAPGVGSTYTAPAGTPSMPGAAVGGAIPPPPTTWDPYGTPGAPSGPLLSQDPLIPAAACPSFSMGTMQKFIQHVDLGFNWFAGNGDHELGIDDVNLSATFAFPIFGRGADPCTPPLLVTPGFAVHYWSGPVSEFPSPPDFRAPADMPPRTYDAYLDFAWNPQFNSFLGAELNFRTGVFSDFFLVTNQSLRYTGKGMGVLRLSDHMVVKAGIWYIDRVNIKLLPAGGLAWTPNPDVYFDIFFPNPEIGRRLTTYGNTEWWMYARGDYGGGVWTIRRNTDFYNGVDFPKISDDLVEYDDIRVAAGLRFKTLRQMQGNFEVGLACSRQLNYKSDLPSSFFPNNTVYIGAGLSY
ncbi:MAG: hypothetical protein ABFC96_09125 [Thermoguttaceae bacterium]